MKTRLECVISGKVQGVFFRDFIQERAFELGLTGLVSNRHDGTVSFIAEGEKPQLEKLLVAAQAGPARAEVTNIDMQWLEPIGEFFTFSVVAGRE
ncbi:MAG: acylphosphatase [Candidatus Yonathbacteria bacterium CG_4_10_14_3_um_filter_47_65]|uniref:acylphosphatase n=2 Tax=Parcubacteria group TaxID=1794811 RepID=A0A2M8D655_9BACT|nr:MAG: hypothetical protein AUJ44_02650 [Candidatus Nomurabacteria bacterium CG1_02_47_685]PIP03399.1 MAG: acylphosphatase [Candidatus Yonathbacteria bacterium CG23_combo_of_CG06-09_8_20_14_all_46_18]PIQ32886.1 MAG: acylphosphatase [Candidatus Yonathbacteria bacterium CG17_big_fil_post_rev_8_21_14_2_50_46_19]PIX56640.1 MAG: acylphosphatase [Candidatus Yonathbacteria bacterium CG_4_10_14_3_um_filter_47_65]PIY57492.1 MAG: acylphosphatase [Candidatus Yonathbacteria bacterium CG_4_10_14_0_8_um_fil